jgi:hypothetical protein
MIITEKDIHEIQTRIRPILGKDAWAVSLGVGSFVTIEFGNPVSSHGKSKYLRGEWHLWITYCAWRLERGDKVIAASEDPRPKLRNAIQCMEGLTLHSVHVTPPALETAFMFGEEVVLRLFPIYSGEDYEHWMLYTPDRQVLVIGPGTSWAYESSSEPLNST